MKLKLIFLFTVSLLVLMSCSVKPQKIEYGKDACNFCKMNIVETKFAAQIVTNKGRSVKYDAVECLLNDIKDKEEQSLAYILVTDYTKPKELIDATKATYLISKKIKSPMGANLSAYATKKEAQLNGDNLFNWQTLKAHFNK